MALAVSPAGDFIALAWTAGTRREPGPLHFVALDQTGRRRTDADLDLPVSEPSMVDLTMSAGADLHLTWIDEEDGTPGLFYARVTRQGEIAADLRRLSRAGFGVRDYEVTRLPSGELLVVWADRSGLVAVRVTDDGVVSRLGKLGRDETAQLGLALDGAGAGHLVWWEGSSVLEQRFYYATLDAETGDFTQPQHLVTEHARGGIGGPVVSVAQRGEVYATWTVSFRQSVGGSGSTPRARGYYASFQPGQAGPGAPRRIEVPSLFPPSYHEAGGEYAYRQLAPPLPDGVSGRGAAFYAAPTSIAGQKEQSPVAFGMWTQTQWGRSLQPALLIFEDGRLKGYEVVGWTRQPSLHPVLGADEGGDLYLAWLEASGGESFPVYLASTAPSLRAAWDSLTINDLSAAAERGFGRIMSGVSLLPVGVAWIIFPGLWMLVAAFIFRVDNLHEPGARLILFTAIGLHWAGKYLVSSPDSFLPRLIYLPLMVPLLVQIAPETLIGLFQSSVQLLLLETFLSYVLPGVTMLVAVAGAYLFYLRGRKVVSVW